MDIPILVGLTGALLLLWAFGYCTVKYVTNKLRSKRNVR